MVYSFGAHSVKNLCIFHTIFKIFPFTFSYNYFMFQKQPLACSQYFNEKLKKITVIYSIVTFSIHLAIIVKLFAFSAACSTSYMCGHIRIDIESISIVNSLSVSFARFLSA